MLNEVDKLVNIVHGCIKEVNSKDYESWEIHRFLNELNSEK